ncbi:hypothetical protein MICRO8M_80202 [Microbacterium sp. 8M]|nr:hypothetical protein MICRO8M_80202 [Microbacterium sp. 8M]
MVGGVPAHPRQVRGAGAPQGRAGLRHQRVRAVRGEPGVLAGLGVRLPEPDHRTHRLDGPAGGRCRDPGRRPLPALVLGAVRPRDHRRVRVHLLADRAELLRSAHAVPVVRAHLRGGHPDLLRDHAPAVRERHLPHQPQRAAARPGHGRLGAARIDPRLRRDRAARTVRRRRPHRRGHSARPRLNGTRPRLNGPVRG